MIDYNKLLDEEVLAFIATTEKFYPSDAATHSLEKQREYYNKLCDKFHAGRPQDIIFEDQFLDRTSHSIAYRSYEKSGVTPDALVLYFHGGGWALGGLESHDDACVGICDKTGNKVISVDYRLAPEHLHPSSFEDCLFAYRNFAGTSYLPIVLAGDSAGGNLAAAVCHAVRGDEKRPVGQVLIYPSLGDDFDTASYLEHANAPALTRQDMIFYIQIRRNAEENLHGVASHSPLRDVSFADLPPTVLFAAEYDPLFDDSKIYEQKIIEADGKAKCLEEHGLIHGYIRARHSSKKAAASFDRIVESISSLSKNEWLY